MMSQSHPPYEILFKAFVDRKLAIQIARKQTRNTPHSWEDACQAAYAKLWQATLLGKFRQGDLEDYCHWATRVCYFAIKDHIQHSHQRQHESLNQPFPGTDLTLEDTLIDDFDALDALERADLLQALLSIIADLDRDHPKPIHQAIWQALLLDKKQKDIAQELGMSASDICRYWGKIRKRVAETYQLRGDHDTDDDRMRSDHQW
jgi:RNA polymerase sigma factor (sigma-70 family)